MKAIKHHGYFKDGRLHADTFKRDLDLYRERGVPVVLTVAEWKQTRSNQANRYYWGVVIPCIQSGLKEGGLTASEASTENVHLMLKARFLKQDKPIGNDGEFITIIPSTSTLSTDEFSQYIEHCVQFAAEYLNVIVPDPGNQVTLELE